MLARVALFVLLITLWGAQARAGGLTVVPTSVEPRSSSAAIAWQASGPARVVLEYGLTDEYGVWSKPTARTATGGRVLLAGLEPGTAYRFRIDATGEGQLAQAAGTFTTAAIPPRTNATATANALFLDWQPFFPRMVWKECPWLYGSSLAAGINLFVGNGCGGAREQLDALAGRAFSVIDAAQAADVGGRGTVGWYLPDEADLHQGAASLPALPPSRQSRRVTFLTLSNHFFSAAAQLPGGRAAYPALIARAEMIGFDLYPLQIWCRRGVLHATYEAQRELVALAAGKPTFQWIEAGQMEVCLGLEPSAATVRAETWLAIAGGARGIGWFPDNWKPDVAAAIAAASREIASLAPALLAPEVPVDFDQSSPVKAGARRYNGATYVIAANSSTSRAQAKFNMPGLKARSMQVYGENRSVPVSKGTIKDYFRGLAVHVYVAPPTPALPASAP